MEQIKTSSWRTKLPAGHVRIGISRGAPRGMKGYRRYPKLNPGSSFMTMWPISTRVNTPDNDDPSLLEAV